MSKKFFIYVLFILLSIISFCFFVFIQAFDDEDHDIGRVNESTILNFEDIKICKKVWGISSNHSVVLLEKNEEEIKFYSTIFVEVKNKKCVLYTIENIELDNKDYENLDILKVDTNEFLELNNRENTETFHKIVN